MVVSKRCPAGETRKTRGGWKGMTMCAKPPQRDCESKAALPCGSYATRYARWTAPLRAKPWRIEALRRLNGLLTCLFYGAYVLLIAVVLLRGNPAALIALMAVPAAGFVLLSLVRKRLDRPRPYETCEGVQPLIARDGSGESFPSRHTFSAFAIATSWAAVSWAVAAVLLLAACLVGACRVLGGVHFPRDVVVGALTGLAAGTLAVLAAAAL